MSLVRKQERPETEDSRNRGGSAARACEAAHPPPGGCSARAVSQGAPGPAPALRHSSGLPLTRRSGLLLLHIQTHLPAEHDGLQETGKRKH